MNTEYCWKSADKQSDKWQPYFEIYDRHLTPISHRTTHLVEVGVQKGGSLKMWSDCYGGSTKITGIDIDPACANLEYADNDNVFVIIGDQSSSGFWDETLPKLGNFEVFIDDGGHFMDQQILTFEKVFPALSLGGIYICEDTHTSYMNFNGGGLKRKSSFVEYAKMCLDTLHKKWWEELDSELELLSNITTGLTSVHFYDSIIVFEKFGKKDMVRAKQQNF